MADRSRLLFSQEKQKTKEQETIAGLRKRLSEVEVVISNLKIESYDLRISNSQSLVSLTGRIAPSLSPFLPYSLLLFLSVSTSSKISNHADCQCCASTSLLAQRRRPPRRRRWGGRRESSKTRRVSVVVLRTTTLTRVTLQAWHVTTTLTPLEDSCIEAKISV